MLVSLVISTKRSYVFLLYFSHKPQYGMVQWEIDLGIKERELLLFNVVLDWLFFLLDLVFYIISEFVTFLQLFM